MLTISSEILTDEARRFLDDLHRRFNARRLELLAARQERQLLIDAGGDPDFLEETAAVRSGSWKVAPVPADLEDRRVEITGPVDRKMMINALNSGASAFMADFEDSNTPTWENVLQGQKNLLEAHRGTLRLETDEKTYTLGDDTATLLVRPRGWHLSEKHFEVDGEPIAASLFDFGLYLFWGGRAAIEAGSGPYLYLPKLESHLEARLWNDVFVFAQERLGIPIGTIKATVLIETILAAFEMDEILFELRNHSAGLNAGRWDYIFSVIKKFRNRPGFLLPDRGQVTMLAPFMKAYTDLQVATCHKRGAHAIGGMAAFIPNRRDPEITEQALAKVAADKRREAAQGCDGTWVAHPDLVDVARAEFDAVLGDRPNQIEVLRQDVTVKSADLLDTAIPGGTITEAGLRTNISVGVRYLASWLSGNGAAAIDNLMEDAATAEISRSQIWQWVHNGAVLADGRPLTEELVRLIADDEIRKIRSSGLYGDLDAAARVFEEVALSADFVDFLTLPAYELIA
ncbi:MAG: malate synthase A [Acidimicrobiia bacterium]|nr:malate synthase A [Acidimicrobiia bacterium]